MPTIRIVRMRPRSPAGRPDPAHHTRPAKATLRPDRQRRQRVDDADRDAGGNRDRPARGARRRLRVHDLARTRASYSAAIASARKPRRASGARRRPCAPTRRVSQHAAERGRQRRRIVPIDEQPIDAVGHDLARPRRAGGDDRHAARHRLDQHVAEPFVARGQREHVGARDVPPGVPLKAAEHHRVRRGRSRRSAARIAASSSPCAENEQPRRHALPQHRERVDQQRIVLRVGEPPAATITGCCHARRRRADRAPRRRAARPRRCRTGLWTTRIAMSRDAERRDQIVGDALRGRHDPRRRSR